MVTAERERQIRENLGLVHTVANRFRGRGIEYDDLYQSGCVGLIKAVDRFDPTLGYAFSTYAVPVIIGEIKRLFRDGGAVKVSRVLKEKALHAARLREDFLRREGREPTIGELAELLSCDPAEAAEIVGVLARLAGLRPDMRPLAAADLLADFRLEHLPRQDVCLRDLPCVPDWLRPLCLPC